MRVSQANRKLEKGEKTEKTIHRMHLQIIFNKGLVMIKIKTFYNPVVIKRDSMHMRKALTLTVRLRLMLT